MKNSTGQSLFVVLKKLIPELPDSCTRVELILSVRQPPELRCDFIVKRSGEFEEEHKRYTLAEIEP